MPVPEAFLQWAGILSALVLGLGGLLAGRASRRREDATALGEVSKAMLSVVTPLNQRVEILSSQVEQYNITVIQLQERLSRQGVELTALRNLANSQDVQIDALEKTVEGQAVQIVTLQSDNAILMLRLTKSESAAAGLEHGVGVLINQLERAGISPEYHPTAAAPMQVVVTNSEPIAVTNTPKGGGQ
jgi:hypothetical protein